MIAKSAIFLSKNTHVIKYSKIISRIFRRYLNIAVKMRLLLQHIYIYISSINFQNPSLQNSPSYCARKMHSQFSAIFIIRRREAGVIILRFNHFQYDSDNKPSFYKNTISNILSHFVNGSVHDIPREYLAIFPRTQTHEFFQPGPLRVNNLALPFRRPTSPRAALLVRQRGGGICSTRDFAFTNGRAKRAGVRGNGIRFLRATPRTRGMLSLAGRSRN